MMLPACGQRTYSCGLAFRHLTVLVGSWIAESKRSGTSSSWRFRGSAGTPCATRTRHCWTP